MRMNVLTVMIVCIVLSKFLCGLIVGILFFYRSPKDDTGEKYLYSLDR